MTHSDSISHQLWKNRSHTYKSVIGALAVLLGGTALIMLTAALKTEPEPKVAEEPSPTNVETITAEPQAIHISVASQGSVLPLHKIKLVSEVAGKVVAAAKGYADGAFFSKNQGIVTIDDRDYHFALSQAEAEVAKARELHAIEKGRGRQAKREWRDIGDLEANELFLRKPQLSAAQAGIDAALANRDKAKLNLSRTKIGAPFDGRISIKHVDIGQYVTPGTVIAEVYSTEAVQVRLPLTDRQIAKVDLPLTAQPGEKSQYPEVILSTVFGGQTYTWRGKIVRTEGTLDIKSRVVFAVAEVENPYLVDDADKPPLAVGMYVSAEIIGRKVPNIVKLPRKALSKKDQIILVDDNNKLRYKTVEVMQSDGENILVSGLTLGERVMVTRIPYAVAGLKVNPDPEHAVAEAPELEEPEKTSGSENTPSNSIQEG